MTKWWSPSSRSLGNAAFIRTVPLPSALTVDNTCGVDATINCTHSPGRNPEYCTEIGRPGCGSFIVANGSWGFTVASSFTIDSDGGSGGGATSSTMERSRSTAVGRSPFVGGAASSGGNSTVVFLLSSTPTSVFTTFAPSVFTTVVSISFSVICVVTSYFVVVDCPSASPVLIANAGTSFEVENSIWLPSAAAN